MVNNYQKKKKDKTGRPLKTEIFVLASSGNFVHPMKKISQTKSRVSKFQACLGWIIMVCSISRGSCARTLTQNIQRRCPDMSATVKDLVACSWHWWLSLFGIPSNINCAKCRIYGVNSFEKEEIASLTTIQTTFTECLADPGAAYPFFPSSPGEQQELCMEHFAETAL